jgi:hypothetical protein
LRYFLRNGPPAMDFQSGMILPTGIFEAFKHPLVSPLISPITGFFVSFPAVFLCGFRSTARNVNATNVSLLRSNADCMAGERTRSRNRITVVASGRLWVGARFCDSKRCAILVASIIRDQNSWAPYARRRLKIIPNAFGERAVLKLMFGALIRAAERWRSVKVTEFERRQIAAVRKELDDEYEAAVGLNVQPSKGGAQAKISSNSQT